MPPTVDQARQLKQIFDAYRAQMRVIVGRHRQRLRALLTEAEKREQKRIQAVIAAPAAPPEDKPTG